MRSTLLRSNWFTHGAFLVAGVCLALIADTFRHGFNAPAAQADVHLGQSGFINPLLDCSESSNLHLPPAQADLENRVEDLVEELRARDRIKEASVYFRDLNNGPSFGINEKAQFSGASLLKVPVLISYLKRLEVDPQLISKTIVFDPKVHEQAHISQTVEPPPPLKAGESYAVEVLLARMILMSDNSASNMLLDNNPHLGGPVDIIGTLREMGVIVEIVEGDAALTVKDYASVFRILYNSTYLQRTHSDSALRLLARSSFKRGLVAGSGGSFPVAHKFGERSIGETFQFHDCGIVYYPNRPYLLCIMTRGENTSSLIEAVAEISKTVHERISAQR